MGDEYYNEDLEEEEEDDGFEDCMPGGLRPNYKIPILLCDMAEEVLDEIIQSESNALSCATCGFRFSDFDGLREHFGVCDCEPKEDTSEFEKSHFHTNALLLALKDLYTAGAALSPVKTETRLPFYREPFAGVNGEHHNRINGNLSIVTCRMCKLQYVHRTHETPTQDIRHNGTVVSDEEQDVDPSLIKYHVKLCREYSVCHNQFLETMKPFVDKVKYHFDKLFDIYKMIRSSIYGSGFKVRANTDPFSWREMGTIYEVDESSRSQQSEAERASHPLKFRNFDFKLHNIEPENVCFIRTNYFNGLNETLDNIFFTTVTGL